MMDWLVFCRQRERRAGPGGGEGGTHNNVPDRSSSRAFSTALGTQRHRVSMETYAQWNKRRWQKSLVAWVRSSSYRRLGASKGAVRLLDCFSKENLGVGVERRCRRCQVVSRRVSGRDKYKMPSRAFAEYRLLRADEDEVVVSVVV